MLEVDERNLQLPRECAADLLLGDIPRIDENAAELAPAALLLVQRGLELVLRQQFLLKQDFTQSNFFWSAHRSRLGLELLFLSHLRFMLQPIELQD